MYIRANGVQNGTKSPTSMIQQTKWGQTESRRSCYRGEALVLAIDSAESAGADLSLNLKGAELVPVQ